jgi:hypothetical protein
MRAKPIPSSNQVDGSGTTVVENVSVIFVMRVGVAFVPVTLRELGLTVPVLVTLSNVTVGEKVPVAMLGMPWPGGSAQGVEAFEHPDCSVKTLPN